MSPSPPDKPPPQPAADGSDVATPTPPPLPATDTSASSQQSLLRVNSSVVGRARAESPTFICNQCLVRPSSRLDAVRNAFLNDDFTDLTITCQDRAWRVHKVICCHQSKVLYNAVKGSKFLESQTNKIDFPDDDPPIIKAMIQFLYLGFYINPYSETGLQFDAAVYTLADKNLLEPLKALAMSNFTERAQHSSNEEFAKALAWVYGPECENAETLKPILVRFAWQRFISRMHAPESSLLQELLREGPRELLLDLLEEGAEPQTAPTGGLWYSQRPVDGRSTQALWR